MVIQAVNFEGWTRGEILTLVGILLAALAVVLASVTIAVTLGGWTMQAWLNERRIARDFGADLYSVEDIRSATRFYVRPDAASIDLIQELEKGDNIIATREDLFRAVRRFLEAESSHRHLLLLADSGMGKSSFVLNYYAFNRSRWRNKSRLAVVPLGHHNAVDIIKQIHPHKRRETILFLDAFDEDLEAVKNYWVRLNELMSVCGGFRRVLITCRTQFFPQESAIPQLATMVVGPRSGPAHHTFWRLYLAPFSDRQVDEYLKRRFGFWGFQKKAKARSLVKKVPNLTVRPLLLSYITELLEADSPLVLTWEVYSALTTKWYKRETFWKDFNHLEMFSEELAIHLYLGFLEHGFDRVERTVIVNIIKNLFSSVRDIDEWKATSRSLLHRDAAGNWKFAHRSIMEFLFLKRFFEGDKRCQGRKWSEQMKSFVLEKDASGSLLLLSLGPISGADLSGTNLTGVNFQERDLSTTDLSNTDLRRAMLAGSILRGANLAGANFTDAELQGQDLRDAKLLGAVMHHTNLSNADLSGSDLRRTSLNGANLTRTNFRKANLSGLDLSKVDLQVAVIAGSDLSDSLLDHKSFVGMDLSNIQFNRSSLRGTNLSNADLRNAKLLGAELSEANLIGSNMMESQARGANFGKAILQNGNLRSADFSRALFVGADLRSTDFRRSILHEADLTHADLTDALLIDADLTNADLRGATLTNTDFRHAKLLGTKLRRADIQQALNIDATELSKAIVEQS